MFCEYSSTGCIHKMYYKNLTIHVIRGEKATLKNYHLLDRKKCLPLYRLTKERLIYNKKGFLELGSYSQNNVRTSYDHNWDRNSLLSEWSGLFKFSFCSQKHPTLKAIIRLTSDVVWIQSQRLYSQNVLQKSYDPCCQGWRSYIKKLPFIRQKKMFAIVQAY